MKIQTLSLKLYQIPLTNGSTRSGALVKITSEEGNSSWGEIAPLPNWSQETLDQALNQLEKQKQAILTIDWTASHCLQQLAQLTLYPSVTFGLESALLSLLAPLPPHTIQTSALLMGSPEEIMEQAKLRLAEGFTSAKLKVGHLSFQDASKVVHALKDRFRLRIDVNRAWNTADSLRFFSTFPQDAFDYVEEPFKNPRDLAQFKHPLAVDESFPQDLSLEQLEALPTLKAVIYKPTIQGGMTGCLTLHKWAAERGVEIVLSSSFESTIGLAHIASMAHRLSLSSPIGIGTYHYMRDHLSHPPLSFLKDHVHIPRSMGIK